MAFIRVARHRRWTTLSTYKCVYLVPVVYLVLYTCDLDVDFMTFIYELDLDIPNMYLFTKMNILSLYLSLVFCCFQHVSFYAFIFAVLSSSESL